MNYLLYNPKSSKGADKQKIESIKERLIGDVICQNVLEDDKYLEILQKLTKDDDVILVGGDGTLNKFVNKLGGKTPEARVYLYANGTGDDFFKDVSGGSKDEKILINKYIENLPTVTVKGETYYFINGVGYGIDGYCCEEGDRLHALSDKPVNYTKIAIKGILFKYKAANATVTVDGVTKTYKKCYIAPTMNGRYYGGGMLVAPKQDRLGDGSLTFVTMYGKGRLKTLMVFPSIFKGEHVNHTDMVDTITGREITVKFDRPTALQIDGETISNVLEYTARSGK